MDKSTIKTLGNAVGFTVAMDRKGVIGLLKQYNIPVSENPNNGELISLVINKGLTNDSFRKDFQALTLVMKSVAKKLGKRPKSASTSSSFIPQNDLINGGWASADGGTDWGGLAGSLVGSATSIFTTIKATDAQRKLAEAQAKISADQTASAIAQGQTQLEIEKLKLQQLQLVGSQPTSNSSKTLLYVGIGFGALLLIGGLVLVLKKK